MNLLVSPLILFCAATVADSVAPPVIDSRAVQLLSRVEAKVRAAQTIAVDRTRLTLNSDGSVRGRRTTRVQVQRPASYRIEVGWEVADRDESWKPSRRVSDGKQRLTTNQGRTAVEGIASEDNYVWDGDVDNLAGLFIIDEEHPGTGHEWRARKLRDPNFMGISYIGKESWEGAQYDVVEWKYGIGYYLPEDQVYYTQRVFVGADTLVHRIVTRTSKGVRLEEQLRNFQLGVSFPPATFDVTPPAGAAPPRAYPPRYLSAGNQAPDFTLPTVGGDSVTLSKFLQGKRAVMLWFWGFG